MQAERNATEVQSGGAGIHRNCMPYTLIRGDALLELCDFWSSAKPRCTHALDQFLDFRLFYQRLAKY